MRDKHIHISADSALLKTIHMEVHSRLDTRRRTFVMKLGFKFAFYFTATILGYVTLYTVAQPLLFILCFVLYGFAALLFAFNFSHDFSHNTIFRSKKLNHFFFVCIYTLVGAHAEAWKQRHLHSHHFAPNVDGYDSDLRITGLIRVLPHSRLKRFHRLQHLYAPLAYTTYSLYWVFVKDFVILFTGDEFTEKRGVRYHCSFWVQKLFYLGFIVVLPLIFAKPAWQVVLIGFLSMHLTQSLFLLFTFFMTHHVEGTAYPTTDENGHITTSWLMNQVKSSNDMHPFSEAANFILGGFNNHIAHHLFPHVHHLYYPQLNRILYSILRRHGIEPNRTTYWGGIVSHLKLLKRMGRTGPHIDRVPATG